MQIGIRPYGDWCKKGHKDVYMEKMGEIYARRVGDASFWKVGEYPPSKTRSI